MVAEERDAIEYELGDDAPLELVVGKVGSGTAPQRAMAARVLRNRVFNRKELAQVRLLETVPMHRNNGWSSRSFGG